MNDLDREALERALPLARQESESRAEQLDSMAAEDWTHAAKLAACICQRRALGLTPGDEPPMHGDIEPERHPEANELLERMLAAGVSRYEPDPLAALKAAGTA